MTFDQAAGSLRNVTEESVPRWSSPPCLHTARSARSGSTKPSTSRPCDGLYASSGLLTRQSLTVGSAASPDLVIAVCDAGAIGRMPFWLFPTEQATALVARLRSATSKLLYVNYALVLEPRSLPAVLEAGAPVVQFSWASRMEISSLRSAKPVQRWAASCGSLTLEAAKTNRHGHRDASMVPDRLPARPAIRRSGSGTTNVSAKSLTWRIRRAHLVQIVPGMSLPWGIGKAKYA